MKITIFLSVFLLSLILFCGTPQNSNASAPTTSTIEQLLNKVDEGADIEITIIPPMDEVYPFVKKKDCEVKDGFLVISAYGGQIYIPISNLLTIRAIPDDDGTILSLRFWFR